MRDFAKALVRRWFWFWLCAANWGIATGGVIGLIVTREYGLAVVLAAVSCVWVHFMRKEWRRMQPFTIRPTTPTRGSDE